MTRLFPSTPSIVPPAPNINPMEVQSADGSDGSSSILTPESVEDDMAPTPLQSNKSSDDGSYGEEEAAESQDQIQFSSELDEA